MWSQRAAARDIKTRNRISGRGWRIVRLHARWQENKVNNVEWGSCPPSPLSDISRPFGDSLFPSDYLILTAAAAAAVLAVYHLNSWGDDSGFSITPHTFCLLSSYRFSGFTPGICACNFLSTSNILFLLFKKKKKVWQPAPDFWGEAGWVMPRANSRVIAQEGAPALSDPVSHSCQFSELAGPYCLWVCCL